MVMIMKYYINIFFIYSFLGFVIETILKFFFFHNLNNGILYGPIIPVYGFGTCLIIFIERFIFNRIKTKRFFKIILLFLISTLSLTLLEFIGGNLIKLLFHKTFWNYSDMKYNFGPFICLEISLIWGIMSLVIVYVIKPKLDKLIKKIPSSLTYLALLLLLIDIILTIKTI